jgi:hypothetical protein
MPSAAKALKMETVGNWEKEIGGSLARAAASWREATGASGEKACKKALAAMMIAAGSKRSNNITNQSKKKRPIEREKGRKFFTRLYSDGGKQKFYEWYWEKYPEKYSGSFDEAREIKTQGLARRSWTWGLPKLGKAGGTSTPIPGTSRVFGLVKGRDVGGYVKENRLGYINKAMEPGWQQEAKRKGIKKLLVEKYDMERKQARAIQRRDRRNARALRSVFKGVAG